MDTLLGLREDMRALPEKQDRDLFDLFCDKLWLAGLIYFMEIFEASVN